MGLDLCDFFDRFDVEAGDVLGFHYDYPANEKALVVVENAPSGNPQVANTDLVEYYYIPGLPGISDVTVGTELQWLSAVGLRIPALAIFLS